MTPENPLLLKSKSMEPTLHPGDQLKWTPKTNYSSQDIVLFKNHRNDLLVVHRYLETSFNYAITYGENNLFVDRPVLLSSIFGAIQRVNPSPWHIPPLPHRKKGLNLLFFTLSIYYWRLRLLIRSKWLNH